MKDTIRKLFQTLPNLAKYVLAFSVVVAISFLFPRNAKFNYRFDKGQTWRYDDLVAEFDFAIRKTPEELSLEIEQANAEFTPYYDVDVDVLKEKRKTFSDAFNEQLQIAKRDAQFQDVLRNPKPYHDYGVNLLEKVYRKGVIPIDTLLKNKGKDFVINIIQGNTAEKQTLQNLYTVDKIVLFLKDSLPHSRLKEPDFIYPLMENLFDPNLIYNDAISQKFRKELMDGISQTSGMVKKGETIVAKNSVLTPLVYQKLYSYKEQIESGLASGKSNLNVIFGYLLLTCMIVGVFLMYLQRMMAPVFARFRWLFFLMTWIVIYSYVVYLVELSGSLNVWMIPFCVSPIVISHFYNERLAFITHIATILISSIVASLGYEFLIVQMLAGLVTIISRKDIRVWSNFFISISYIVLSYTAAHLGISLIEEGALGRVDWYDFPWFFLNGFLTLLAYPLIPLLGRVFGLTSSFTLVELSDMNHPLLRELSLKAPGTLQHSLQVANLSEAAAARIGADPLLVKVGALYHDIGKSKNPEYFIENQRGENPHKLHTTIESARIIIDHVPEGVRLARKHRLPEVLTQFITTHHGTTRVEYFYRTFVHNHPDTPATDSDFRYPGPLPKSREETILMMADSLEATAKSLKNPTGGDIDHLVEKIIGDKISQRQFIVSELNFEELEQCKDVFKQTLKSIHHLRIEYPKES